MFNALIRLCLQQRLFVLGAALILLIYGSFSLRQLPVDVFPDLNKPTVTLLTEAGGIEAFFQREVLPHADDAWIDMNATKIGYEVSFARYFYKPVPLRTLEQIRDDIVKLEQQTEGLLQKIIGGM